MQGQSCPSRKACFEHHYGTCQKAGLHFTTASSSTLGTPHLRVCCLYLRHQMSHLYALLYIDHLVCWCSVKMLVLNLSMVSCTGKQKQRRMHGQLKDCVICMKVCNAGLWYCSATLPLAATANAVYGAEILANLVYRRPLWLPQQVGVPPGQTKLLGWRLTDCPSCPTFALAAPATYSNRIQERGLMELVRML